MPNTTESRLWQDRKRYFGMPISFTVYSLSEDRLFRETGLLSRTYEEVLLYRVRDISLKRSLGQMIFGVGTITIHSSDKSSSTLEIENVKSPKQVKELIHQLVEESKTRRRFRFGEFDTIGDDNEDVAAD
ncbi:MAG: PH domain-containing protein [Oscillospiraceae bacterium]|nr:PH domain-containing protein [Oscillospiraceae bacterium]